MYPRRPAYIDESYMYAEERPPRPPAPVPYNEGPIVGTIKPTVGRDTVTDTCDDKGRFGGGLCRGWVMRSRRPAGPIARALQFANWMLWNKPAFGRHMLGTPLVEAVGGDAVWISASASAR